ncbi:hypothetical protein [Deinococcus pimensis]|uniref:hypothetical protein n=1 Tax=Deinococcus pimensis TaxID=309888 RepID=UPI0004AD62BB|nr:hypothetical protein [Deinococcus pimensis]
MTTPDTTPDDRRPTHVERLRRRLDDLTRSIARRPGALALLGLGSSGAHAHRMDEYSDLDFFVVVEPGARERFLREPDWLRDAAPVAYDFENSPVGRKVLFDDGVFCEYAVFTEQDLAGISEPSMRVIWSRDPARDWSAVRTRPVATGWGHDSPDFHLGEALTNLYVGLLRERRGEHLTAMRFIQVYAVDRLLCLHALSTEPGAQRDPYVVDRRAESWASQVPIATFCPGYTRNVAAAAAILDWLVTHRSPAPIMVEAIRGLLAIQSGRDD